MIIATGLSQAIAGPTHGNVEVWVSPSGSSQNPGTRARPVDSIATAQEKIRAINQSNSSNHFAGKIVLGDGIFGCLKPVIFAAHDSGTNDAPLVIEAAPNAHPVLSGGLAVKGWEKLTRPIPGSNLNSAKNVWVARALDQDHHPIDFRQLWVNGQKAIRAREPNAGNLLRLTGWDKNKELAAIPSSALKGLTNSAQLEMIIDQVWEIADLRIAGIAVQDTNALLSFKEPEAKIEFHHPWPPVMVNSNYAAPFFLANAIQFLDSPGEWFEDLKSGTIYYWPRAGEDMTKAKVFAPALETVVEIAGSPDAPVSNIRFKGITFAYTTWLQPSEQGHVPLQAGMPMLEARKLSPKGTDYHPGLDNVAWISRPPAAVSVRNAAHIMFENCAFEHTASAALDFDDGTHDDLVQGCVFRDIGGNGIQLGKFSNTNVETHTPWNPSDEREICSHEKISNNLITDCGAEDWGCVGISVGYARNITIEHNEVFNLPYSGISVGWGWSKRTNALRDNFIFANHIHHVGKILNDLGGIYTLSAQPGTTVAENAVHDIEPSPFVPDPQHWFYLYADEGSSYMTFRDNWCPSEKFLRNANGPGNVWTNNGPAVSETIKNAAGLEPAFRHLLTP